MITVANLLTKPHNACFVEVANAFSMALWRLNDPSRHIVFGANDANMLYNFPDAIFYNAEALGSSSPFKVVPKDVFKHTVWDYAQSNVERWKSLEVNAVHCPVGYISSMEVIKPLSGDEKEDIDVLFYGWVNDRRAMILRALEAAKLRVLCLPYGTYGETRDAWIARSKIVLNLHYYDHSIFEIFRVSHLLANRKCVVTEAGGNDAALEHLARRTCAYAERGQIVDACRALIADDEARRVQAEQGYNEFKRTDLVENVRQALGASGGPRP